MAATHGNEFPGIMSVSAYAILVAVLSSALHATGTNTAPWFGTWQLEPPKTALRWFETPPYQKVTITIEPSAETVRETAREASGPASADTRQEGLRVTYDMVRTRGGITHMEWLGRFDAKDYPVQGAAYFMTNAYRQIDDRSYEIVIKVDGATAATATAVVSSDGATMTVTTVERAGGKSTAVYKRR
jgi:hypothetical protein